MSLVEEITPIIEECLECIYGLEEKYGVARTKDIVIVMKVVSDTVTNTVRRLLEKRGACYASALPWGLSLRIKVAG
jgi:Mn-dependent DtxR family transcriptional regulator